MPDLIDWKNWNENECIEAWNKLKSQYSAIELMYAFYGGLLAKDMAFGGSIVGLKKHFQDVGIIEFSFEKADCVEETTITYSPKIPVRVLKEIVANHSFNEREAQEYRDTYTDDEINHLQTDFYLTCREE